MLSLVHKTIYQNSGSTQAGTITLIAPAVVGNLLVVFVSLPNSGSGTITPSNGQSLPSALTLLQNTHTGFGSVIRYQALNPITGSNVASIGFSFTGGFADFPSFIIYEFSGTVDPAFGNAFANSSGIHNLASSPTGTWTESTSTRSGYSANDTLFLAAFLSDGNNGVFSGVSAPFNIDFLTLAGTSQTGNVAVCWAVSSPGTLNPVATLSPADFAGACTVSFSEPFSSAPTPSTTTVVGVPNPSNSGQNVTFTATVTGQTNTPTGTVTFKYGATTLGTGVLSPSSGLSATTSIVYSALPVGSDVVTASYPGDTNNQASSGSVTQVVSPTPTSLPAITLTRDDEYAFDHFESQHLQTDALPSYWSLIVGPPLTLDLDVGPSVPGGLDVLALQAGIPFNPPASTLLGVPDDWAWVAKWGALADLLGRDSEATDRARADYALKRYLMGLEVMKQSNWLLSATINGVPCDTPAVREQDAYSTEWQDNTAAYPALVTAGMDFCAPCPVPTGSGVLGVSCVLVGNAPIPTLDTDFVQISRDAFDVILDYAQVLAQFKQGGSEFASTKDLEQNFLRFAAQTNKRLAALGIYRDMLGYEGRRQDVAQPRTTGDEK